MLVYFECFNTVEIAHACLRRIFQCGRVYSHFTYNDIYICYSGSKMDTQHAIPVTAGRNLLYTVSLLTVSRGMSCKKGEFVR